MVPWLLAGALLYVMRRLERWLHQHIFKVGWLLTKNLHTTTVLYYTFFLPGVVLHQVVYWLAAGILDVRADRAIAWPEAQAIAELNLNFIKLAPRTNRIKIAIISIAPLISGLALIWLISSDVLNLNVVVALIRSGADLGSVINLLLATPDLWIWVYFLFTIANTMIPDRESLRGWRPVLIGAGILIVVLFLLGVAQEVFLDNLAIPLADGLNRLSLIFAVVIVIDLIVTGVLGVLESIFERITRDSATFQNGKLVAITREELAAQRVKQQRQRQAARSASKTPRTPTGAPSIYKLPLPIPGAPGKDVAEPIIVRREAAAVLSPGETRPAGPEVITGTATPIPEERPLPEAHIDLPPFVTESQLDEDEDEDADEDVLDSGGITEGNVIGSEVESEDDVEAADESRL